MKKLSKVLILTAILTVFMAITAMAAEADMAKSIGCTTGSSLRLRSEPSTSSSVVTHLGKYYATAVLDDSTEGWYKVNYNGNVGYVSADYVTIDKDNIFTTYGRVTGSGVNVRELAATTSAAVAVLNEGTFVTVNGFVGGWYSVTCESGETGYIRSDLLVLSEDKTSNAGIVELAKSFLGVRYVYGGASPSGFDCSGFTMYLCKQYGYSLPHTASGQMEYGTAIAKDALQPGDLVFFRDPSRIPSYKTASHVGLYIGGGQFIHASSGSGYCVKISSLSDNYYATYYAGARRLS